MDDGAADTEMALQMLYEETRQGIQTVVCTPHFYGDRESVQHFIARRDNALAQVQSAVDLRMVLGAEVYVERDISEKADLSACCIGDSNVMLLEMPYLPLANWMVEEAENIYYRYGCRILLAHLSRYQAYYSASDFEKLLSLPDVLVQVNASDVLYRPTRQLVKKWIKMGVPIVFGSDCHNMSGRMPNLEKIEAFVRKTYGGNCPATIANTIGENMGLL